MDESAEYFARPRHKWSFRRWAVFALLALTGVLAGLACWLEPWPWNPANTQRRDGFMPATTPPGGSEDMNDRVVRTDEEWRRILTPEQYRVMRGHGTEAPFCGEYLHRQEPGIYRCAACGNPLFTAGDKFDSGTGWPSFFQPIGETALRYRTDHSLGMIRTEVLCARCDSHLGHVFDDGPPPTGRRFCMNSVALQFEPAPGHE